MSEQLIATAPLVIARDEQGRDMYLYEGMPVPASVSSKECARLKSLGAIGTGAVTAADADVQTPKKSASAGEWTTFAVAQGMDPQVAAKAKKSELVAFYLEDGPAPGTPEGDQDPVTPIGGGEGSDVLPDADPEDDPLVSE